MLTLLFLRPRMSERYTQIGSKGALLVMVLVISVWEMTVPTEAATGECIKTKSASGFILLLKCLSSVPAAVL